MLKILEVFPYYYPSVIYGGPITGLLGFNKTLSEFGHKITIFTTSANGNEDIELPTENPHVVDGTTVWYFPRWWFGKHKKPSKIFFTPLMSKGLGKLQSGEYDVILIHSVWGEPGRLAYRAASRCQIPYVYYTHGSFEPWALRHNKWKKKIYFSLIEKRILQNAAGIVACNIAEVEQLRQLGIKVPIQQMSYCVEPRASDTQPSRAYLERLFPFLEGQPFVLFISRLHPKKGLDLLIPAFAKLVPDFPDWVLVIAGPDEGGYQAYLRRMVKEFGLESRIFFPGLVTGERKTVLLKHAEFFTLPSYSEGMPVAVIEALSYGLPVVITSACYVPGVVEGEAGLVIPTNESHLIQALRNMMCEPDLRQRYSHNALQVSQEHFSCKAVAEKSVQFFRSII